MVPTDEQHLGIPGSTNGYRVAPRSTRGRPFLARSSKGYQVVPSSSSCISSNKHNINQNTLCLEIWNFYPINPQLDGWSTSWKKWWRKKFKLVLELTETPPTTPVSKGRPVNMDQALVNRSSWLLIMIIVWRECDQWSLIIQSQHLRDVILKGRAWT